MAVVIFTYTFKMLRVGFVSVLHLFVYTECKTVSQGVCV